MPHMLEGLPRVDGVEHRMVHVGGVAVHVAEGGQGDPVLMLHGWPQHWYCWRGVIPRLAGRFRIVCPDLRGFGWTEAPGHGYDPDTFAADAVALLDALDIERAHVIGHDWGGFTTFLLGIRHADRVRRAIAINAPHPWPPIDLRTLDATWRAWYAAVLAMPGLAPWMLRTQPGLVRRLMRADNVHPEAIPDEAADSFARRLTDPARAQATSQLYRSYLTTFGRVLRRGGREGRLTVPLRLLFGTRDVAISKSLLRGYEPHADDMEIELVPDSGHFLPDEKPELVAERALEFFAAR
jgi:pimeloyl-ACP methyl ester carboxylesterase